jgi:hypothetical protein
MGGAVLLVCQAYWTTTPTPATAARAIASRHRETRRARMRLNVSRASLRALSPAMSECDGLVASATPTAAAVFVIASNSGRAAGGRSTSVPTRADAGSREAVESGGGFSTFGRSRPNPAGGVWK